MIESVFFCYLLSQPSRIINCYLEKYIMEPNSKIGPFSTLKRKPCTEEERKQVEEERARRKEEKKQRKLQIQQTQTELSKTELSSSSSISNQLSSSSNISHEKTSASLLNIPISNEETSLSLSNISLSDEKTFLSSEYYTQSIEPDSKLVTVVRITDKLEPKNKNTNKPWEVIVLGESWECVVEQKLYELEEFVLFVKPNAILDPNHPYTKNYEGKHILPRKIAGTRSEGLVLPLSVLEFYGISNPKEKVVEGQDVSKLIKARKYIQNEEIDIFSPAHCLSSAQMTEKQKLKQQIRLEAGFLPFPTQLCPKTAQTHAKDVARKLKSLVGKQVVMTFKVDGESSSSIVHQKQLRVCTREVELIASMKNNSNSCHVIIANKYNFKDAIPDGLAVQGEIAGPKICLNPMGFKEHEYFMFDIFDIEKCQYLNWKEVKEHAQRIGANTVPEYYVGPFKEEWSNIQTLKALTDSLKWPNGDPVEGLVLKLDEGDLSRDIRFSVKILSDVYSREELSKKYKNKTQ